jgi:hypothetical protein
MLSGPLLGRRASARQHGLGRGEVSPTIHQRGWVSMDSVPLGCHVAKCRCRPQDNQGRGIVNGLRRSPPALGWEERKGDGPERDQQDDWYPSVTSSPACRLLFPSMLDVQPRISLGSPSQRCRTIRLRPAASSSLRCWMSRCSMFDVQPQISLGSPSQRCRIILACLPPPACRLFFRRVFSTNCLKTWSTRFRL